MTPAATALLVYSAQLLVVVSVATISIGFCRLTVPAARLTYWRGVGALCLALPLLSLVRPAPIVASVAFGEATLAGPTAATAAASLVPAGTLIVWLWICGTAARFAWLALGLFHLRRIRARSAPLDASPDLDALRHDLAPRASFRWTDDLTQPVTFGVIRPVVLLPRRFAALTSEAKLAVARHELLHVARRDWLWILVEEHVRALLWFHPAIWWVLEQVQVSREQLIDQKVVEQARSRKPYMDALMIFADCEGVASPVMTFLQRRHLAARLRQLSKEPRMSRIRLALTTVVLVVLIGAATGGIVSTLPLELPTLQAPSSSRLEIRLAETAAAAGLVESRVGDTDRRIYLHPTPVVTTADITNARAIPAAQSQFSVAVTFTTGASGRLAGATKGHVGRPVAILVDGRVISAPVLRGPISGSAMITGDFTQSDAEKLASALTPVGAPAKPPVANQAASQPVSGQDPGVVLPLVLREVRPDYTQAAKDQKIQGEVYMSAVVLPDGTVGDVTVTQSLDSVYGLDEQSVRAAKQWHFRPGTKNGVPVAVRVEMMMRFTLK